MKVSAWPLDRLAVNHGQITPTTDQPFFPSGYSPEVEENDSGYNKLLHIEQSQYSGPIPPPQALEYYEQILPGAADRILKMAEDNANNLRESNLKQLSLDNTVEGNRHDETRRGQRFGLATVLSMVALAGLAIFCGHPGVAGTICSITIIGVAAVFVSGRKIQNKENASDQ